MPSSTVYLIWHTLFYHIVSYRRLPTLQLCSTQSLPVYTPVTHVITSKYTRSEKKESWAIFIVLSAWKPAVLGPRNKYLHLETNSKHSYRTEAFKPTSVSALATLKRIVQCSWLLRSLWGGLFFVLLGASRTQAQTAFLLRMQPFPHHYVWQNGPNEWISFLSQTMWGFKWFSILMHLPCQCQILWLPLRETFVAQPMFDISS